MQQNKVARHIGRKGVEIIQVLQLSKLPTITACMAPLHSEKNNDTKLMRQIVTFVEYYLLLGVDHFVFYTLEDTSLKKVFFHCLCHGSLI